MLTVATAADDAVQDGDEIGYDLVNFVETCQNSNDVGARVGVLLFKNTG
jgi:hypothetical protein